MQNLREANLLRCLSPNVTLDTSYYLYEKALPHLRAGNRIIELACWTGGLSSFIAENHPECMVVGVDRVRRVVELDRATTACQISDSRFGTTAIPSQRICGRRTS